MEQKKDWNEMNQRRMQDIQTIAIFITSKAGEKPTVHYEGKGFTRMRLILLKLHW